EGETLPDLAEAVGPGVLAEQQPEAAVLAGGQARQALVLPGLAREGLVGLSRRLLDLAIDQTLDADGAVDVQAVAGVARQADPLDLAVGEVLAPLLVAFLVGDPHPVLAVYGQARPGLELRAAGHRPAG